MSGSGARTGMIKMLMGDMQRVIIHCRNRLAPVFCAAAAGTAASTTPSGAPIAASAGRTAATATGVSGAPEHKFIPDCLYIFTPYNGRAKRDRS